MWSALVDGCGRYRRMGVVGTGGVCVVDTGGWVWSIPVGGVVGTGGWVWSVLVGMCSWY